MSLDLARINADLGRDPEKLVAWALGLGKSAIVTTNFRPFEAVILHLVSTKPGATLFDLRAPMRIVFHNDLGVPIGATNGAASVVVYAHANSDVFGSSDAPPLHTNFSGLTARTSKFIIEW